MSRGVLLFLLVATLFYVGIGAFRHLTGMEKLAVTKTVLYSAFCSLLAAIVLYFVVVLF